MLGINASVNIASSKVMRQRMQTGRSHSQASPTAAEHLPQHFEDENSPQNVDKNSASDLLGINDPASIKQSKLMEQRMQMSALNNQSRPNPARIPLEG